MRNHRMISRLGSLLLALIGWSSAARAQKCQTLVSQPLNSSGGTAVIEGCHPLTDGTLTGLGPCE